MVRWMTILRIGLVKRVGISNPGELIAALCSLKGGQSRDECSDYPLAITSRKNCEHIKADERVRASRQL